MDARTAVLAYAAQNPTAAPAIRDCIAAGMDWDAIAAAILVALPR